MADADSRRMNLFSAPSSADDLVELELDRL
jgi:hypothetical protein